MYESHRMLTWFQLVLGLFWGDVHPCCYRIMVYVESSEDCDLGGAFASRYKA